MRKNTAVPKPKKKKRLGRPPLGKAKMRRVSGAILAADDADWIESLAKKSGYAVPVLVRAACSFARLNENALLNTALSGK